jgi:hypothetical protein
MNLSGFSGGFSWIIPRDFDERDFSNPSASFAERSIPEKICGGESS